MPPIKETQIDYPPYSIDTSVPELDLSFLKNSWWDEWEKTGFRIRPQMLKLARDYEAKLLSGKSPVEAISDWAQETCEDMEGFWHEFVCQKVVLLIKAEKRFVNGQWEIICPRYGDKTLSEITSSEERNGAAKEAIEKITDFLITAPPNSMAVFISPAGWSGLKFDDGTPNVYTETQIYLYKVNIFGQIEAIAVRVSNNLRQNMQLYSLLAGENKTPDFSRFTQGEYVIEEIVKNPILINGVESPVKFEEILRAIENVRGSKYALDFYYQGKHVQRTFAELWNHFRNRYYLSRLEEAANVEEDNKRARSIIDGFRIYLENYQFLEEKSPQKIAVALDDALYRLFWIKYPPSPASIKNYQINPEEEKRKEMARIQQLSGCTGGTSTGIIGLPVMPGVKIFSKESGKRIHCGACGKIGEFKEGETCPKDKASDN